MQILRKHLFIYHNGARGDFLASVLIGDILKQNGPDATVHTCGAHSRYYHKIHDIDMIEYNSIPGHLTPLYSFDYYDCIVRIKFESTRDCEQALKLATIKLADRNFQSTVSAYQQYEENFAKLDHKFDYIVPFRDVFNINKIKVLFREFRHRDMSHKEERRIVNNINLNLALLREP